MKIHKTSHFRKNLLQQKKNNPFSIIKYISHFFRNNHSYERIMLFTQMVSLIPKWNFDFTLTHVNSRSVC